MIAVTMRSIISRVDAVVAARAFDDGEREETGARG